MRASLEGKKVPEADLAVLQDGKARTVRSSDLFKGRRVTETKELVAGFWLWEVKDMEEAVAWVKRCPNPMPGPSEIEIRPLYEMADLG